uniref:Uncharacterized protein n=1 Tax=Oryza meridionalis TaxID=40149 RepID=A0A0E0EN47_9ORYZ
MRWLCRVAPGDKHGTFGRRRNENDGLPLRFMLGRKKTTRASPRFSLPSHQQRMMLFSAAGTFPTTAPRQRRPPQGDGDLSKVVALSPRATPLSWSHHECAS